MWHKVKFIVRDPRPFFRAFPFETHQTSRIDFNPIWVQWRCASCRDGRSKCCIAVIRIQLYTYTCGNKINNNDERTRFFRKIYLSHFIRKGCKRVMCEWWVGEWTNCNILTPSSFVFIITSFSFCWTAQSGVLRAHSPLLGAGSHYSILSPTNWLQLTGTYSRTGLYHCLTPTCFLWASHLHRIQPVYGQGYILMSSTGCT